METHFLIFVTFIKTRLYQTGEMHISIVFPPSLVLVCGATVHLRKITSLVNIILDLNVLHACSKPLKSPLIHVSPCIKNKALLIVFLYTF